MRPAQGLAEIDPGFYDVAIMREPEAFGDSTHLGRLRDTGRKPFERIVNLGPVVSQRL